MDDDGSGFGTTLDRASTGRFSVISTQEPADALGGAFALHAVKGSGTKGPDQTAVTARVVIADDHVPTRLAIRTALEEGGFQVVAEASTAESAVERVRDQRPDVALIDIHTPGGGLVAARAIAALNDVTAVVMLTASRNDADLFEALQAGAKGYLLKGIDPARLPMALHGVLEGEAALSRSMVARLVQEFRTRGEPRRPTTGPLAALTLREWEVLELLKDGCTTRQIAERLFVSTGTVRTHVAAVVHKLRVPDRKAAARFAVRR